MFSGNGPPQVVPGMRVVMQLEQHLQSGDRRFPVGVLKPFVNAGRKQQCPYTIDQLAAPELVGVTRGHADHGKKRRDEAAAHQAVMGG